MAKKYSAPSKFGFIESTVSKRVTDIIFPHRTMIDYHEIQDYEAESYIGKEFELDVECYPNYFLIAMRHHETNKVVIFEQSPISTIDRQKLSWCLFAFKFYTFNGNHYDMPLTYMALKGYENEALTRATRMLIDEKMRASEVMEHFNVSSLFINHIDIIEVCPLEGSLKKYAGRLHAKRMQELPYDPYKPLTQQEAEEVKNYCINADCVNTWLLRDALKEQVKLRVALSNKYNQDLRSKSDAQIAEAVISSEISKILGRKVKRPVLKEGHYCEYNAPEFISFQTPQFKKAFEDIKASRFYLDGKGSPMWPHGLGVQEKNKKGELVWVLKVTLNGTLYKLGMGGLHSGEKSVAYVSDENYILLDRDVESYYPRIILNQGLFPKHLTSAFLTIYQFLVDSRIAAKKAKDNVGADSGKIIINGSFGKLGSKYSVLYSPELMLQVTLTGQLCLMMLIEMLELAKIHVISANTDGIVSKVHRQERQKFETIIKYWENITKFKTEETGYAALYSKDVNNYIAVKYAFDEKTKDWSNVKEVCKLKGAYANPWPDKKAQIFRFHVNPTFQICSEAICEMLMTDKPVAHTIRVCSDVTKFTAVRAAKYGAHKDRVYVGKFIRWYSSTNTANGIYSVETGSKIADTDGGMPLMDLPDKLPADINYNWYVKRANSMLVDIGYYHADQLKGQGRFF